MNLTRRERTIIAGLVGLSLVVALLLVVEGFWYSWLGAVQHKVGLCRFKTISSHAPNAGPVKLTFAIDPEAVTAAMENNLDYRVGRLPNTSSFVVSRDFDGVSYNLIFKYLHPAFDGFDLGTSSLDHRPAKSLPCSTPVREVQQNVMLMIEDLPLTEDQKKELKTHIIVGHSAPTLKMPL